MPTLEQYANNPSSTLSADLTAGATTLTVTSAAAFSASGNFRVIIDSELLEVTAVSGTTFTVSRGVEGTTAASHSSGTAITQILTRDGLLSLGSQIHYSDSYAAIPSSSLVGRLFLPNNGINLYRDTGTAWSPWGPLYPFTDPPADTGQTTTLSGNGGSITAGATSFIVASSTGFPATPFLVQIGTEDIKVTNVSGTTWTATRGYNGTTAATHNDGDAVTQINWEWVNQGGASVVRSQGGIFLHAPASASSNARIRKNVAPNTPYTITAFVRAISYAVDFHQYGICFRKASTGELRSFDHLHDGSTNGFVLRVSYWSNATTEVTSSAETTVPGPFNWFQISDDGVNRIFRVSPDGQNWIQHFSEVRTATFTADEIGFYANAQNSSAPDIGLTLHSWKQS